MRSNIRLLAGIRVAQSHCALGAAYVVKNNLADIVVLEADTSTEALKGLMELLGGSRDSGPFETIRDIRIDPTKSKSIAESAGAHPLHTDGSFDPNPPEVFLLQIVEADKTGGGESLFVGIRPMLKAMPSQFQNALRNSDVAFGRADDTGRFDAAVSTVIYPRTNGKLGFRWRDDEQVRPSIVDAKGAPIQEAVGWVREYLARTESLKIAAESGTILVVLNDRVFHGRTALSGIASGRWVRRAWLADLSHS